MTKKARALLWVLKTVIRPSEMNTANTDFVHVANTVKEILDGVAVGELVLIRTKAIVVLNK